MKLENFQYEQILLNKKIKIVAGVDEVGRGCLAGPMVVGCVIWDLEQISQQKNDEITQIRDSKQLSAKKRVILAEFIKQNCLSYSIEKLDSQTIDTLGIGQCTQIGFYTAVTKCKPHPQHVLTDAFEIKKLTKDHQTNIISGDKKSITIAAASIIAKVYRDDLMTKLHENPKYSLYNFDKHKGYGTKLHLEKLKLHGPSDIHRFSFKPIASMKEI